MTDLTFHVEPDAWLPVAELLGMYHPHNSQTRSAEELGAIKRHLTDEGFMAEMIVINPWNGKIVSGHGRTQAAHELGYAGTLPVVYKEYPSEAAHRRAMLRWNLARGHQDPEKQAQEFADLLADFEQGDLAADFGMEDGEFEELLAEWGEDEEPPVDPGPQVDRAEELREKWQVEPGQMWQLGAHRLICGDCTDPAVVERVMGGERAGLLVTSPPYNQKINTFRPSGMHKEGDWVAKVERLAYEDDMPEDDYQSQQRAALNVWYDVMEDGSSVFYNHKNRYRDKRVISPLEWIPGPFNFRQEIIWSRPGSVTQNARMFLPSDERIYWVYKGNDFYFDDSTEIKTWSTVWNIALETNKSHAVAFPLELPSRCIRAASQAGCVVMEPYSGSGTTLIACEQLSRRCRAVEISPAYVSVALQRWADMTGQTPELVTP